MTLEIGIVLTLAGIVFQAGILIGILKATLKDVATKQDIREATVHQDLEREKALTKLYKDFDKRLDGLDRRIQHLEDRGAA